MQNLKLFVPIQKVDVEKREVWGQAVAEVVDKAKEIFDYASSLPLFQAWSAEFEKSTDGKSLGNIRAMHGKVAAGKVIAFAPDDTAKAIDIGTKIVDEGEWQKVLEGVYTGFSIGGNYEKRWKDATDPTLTRYTASPSEISLVDNPCVPTATFSMVKADGSAEAKTFQRYAVLKALVEDQALTNGELFALAAAYLPADSLAKMTDADATMGDVRQELVKLATSVPAPEAAPAPVETPAAPAETAEKATTSAPLKKSMWSVSDFAQCLSTISGIARDAQWEAEYEKDSSALPEKIRAWLAGGIEIFKDMAVEETAELLAAITPAETAKADAPTGLEKVAATPSAPAVVPAAEPLQKFVAADALAKRAEMEKAIGDLTKRAEAAETRLEEMAAEATKLLAVRKGTLRAVAKTADDTSGGSLDKGATPETPMDPIAEMRKSHQRPMRMLERSAPTP